VIEAKIPALRGCLAIFSTGCHAARKDGLKRKARPPFRRERPSFWQVNLKYYAN